MGSVAGIALVAGATDLAPKKAAGEKKGWERFQKLGKNSNDIVHL